MFAQIFLKPKAISFIDTTCHANVARAPPRRGTTAPPLLPEEGFFTPCFPKPNGYFGKSLCKFCLPKARNLFCLPPGGRVDFRKKIREGERVHKQALSPQCTHFSIVGTWRQTHSVYCPKNDRFQSKQNWYCFFNSRHFVAIDLVYFRTVYATRLTPCPYKKHTAHQKKHVHEANTSHRETIHHIVKRYITSQRDTSRRNAIHHSTFGRPPRVILSGEIA